MKKKTKKLDSGLNQCIICTKIRKTKIFFFNKYKFGWSSTLRLNKLKNDRATVHHRKNYIVFYAFVFLSR